MREFPAGRWSPHRADGTALDKVAPANGNKVGGAGACSDEMNGHELASPCARAHVTDADLIRFRMSLALALPQQERQLPRPIRCHAPPESARNACLPVGPRALMAASSTATPVTARRCDASAKAGRLASDPIVANRFKTSPPDTARATACSTSDTISSAVALRLNPTPATIMALSPPIA